jgi:UDP-GlcNAc:undecaprenyl-phosphate GlcNAc-1-phosphate transferase
MLDVRMLMPSLAAFAVGLLAIPIVRRIALAHGFMDNPDRWRKLHRAPIALGGGIAVWLATWAGWVFTRASFPVELAASADGLHFFPGLAIASFLILGLGVIDDRINMRGRHKLAGQIVAATVLVILGLRIDAWTCFDLELNPGIYAGPITVLWILVVVNAFNLIDGMDGFCGSLGLVSSVGIGILALQSGRIDDAILALALAGALAAFLRFNLPPAKIFLGDAGSMTIGMVIAALSARSCVDRRGTAVMFLPILALIALPLLDLTAAVCRRWLKSRSIFMADRGHLHHCLKGRLGSTVAALAAAVGLASTAAGVATASTVYGVGDPAACIVIALSVGVLASTNTFIAAEWRLLLFRIKIALAPQLARLHLGPHEIGQQCHLHGTRDWTNVWTNVVREGGTVGVSRIDLAIELTSSGEVYQGHWSSISPKADEPGWSVVHKLHSGKMVAGLIRVSGGVNAGASRYLETVERLVRVVEHDLVADSTSELEPPVEPLPSLNLSVTSALT